MESKHNSNKIRATTLPPRMQLINPIHPLVLRKSPPVHASSRKDSLNSCESNNSLQSYDITIPNRRDEGTRQHRVYSSELTQYIKQTYSNVSSNTPEIDEYSMNGIQNETSSPRAPVKSFDNNKNNNVEILNVLLFYLDGKNLYKIT